MVNLKPFRAIRPNEAEASVIAALPYDVYSRKEAYEKVKEQPDSFLAIDRPETQFEKDIDMYSDIVYEKAAELLNEWIAKKRFIQDKDACLYLYELTMNGHSQTGIVGCVSIDDYENSIVKKHENTREDKELDRIKHVDTCSAQTGPIFLAYKSNEDLQKIIIKAKNDNPIYDFVAEDGIRHRCWIINAGQKLDNIVAAFKGMESVYIADGHHRAASAIKVGKKRRTENPNYSGNEDFNFFLSVLFPDNELQILDYNRVVKDLNGLSVDEFIQRTKEVVEIIEVSNAPISPHQKGQWAMLLDKKWYLCQVKEAFLSNDPVDGLDVSILQNEILEPVLGIQDSRTDGRIDFIGGIRGLEELENRCNTDCKVAFAMYPTKISELFKVADAGLLMPPKSTWFEPKLRSGLFIHKI